MLKEGQRYTISELRQAIKESASEFKPKLGDGVEDGDKKNNRQAVDDIQKNVSKYDGGVEVVKRKFDKPADRNKTTIDLKFNEVKPGKEWEERVEAQVHGFPSVENEKTSSAKENESLDYEGNEEFYDWRKELQQDRDKEDAVLQQKGIAGNVKHSQSLFNESNNNTVKRLKFKRTVFENAQKAIEKVPEEYKTDGNRFIMMDANGTEYLMECTIDKEFGYAKVEAKKRLNEAKADEELDRMRKLYGYKSSDYFKSSNKSQETLTALHEDIEAVRRMEQSK